MTFSYFFSPNSLLLISDNNEFKSFLSKHYKGLISSEEKPRSKYDVLLIDYGGKKSIDVLKKLGKFAKSVLITGKLSDKQLKQVKVWTKRHKIPVLNGRIIVPPLFTSVEIEKMPKKGGLVLLTDSIDKLKFWMDTLDYEGVGFHSLIEVESQLNLESLLKYLNRLEEVSVIFSDISKKEVYASMKFKKISVKKEDFRAIDDTIYYLLVNTLIPKPVNNKLLVITNGFDGFELKEGEIDKKLWKKLQKFVKIKKPTNLLNIGPNATAETVKKVVEVSKSKIGLFLLVLNPYTPELNEGIVYSLAVLRNQGIPFIVYAPGGEKSEKLRRKLLSFSIPAFRKWFEVKKSLEFLGFNV